MEGVEPRELQDQLVESRRVATRQMVRTLELAVRMDETAAHVGQFPDTAAWLAWNLGTTRRTARKWLRMGLQLRDLPLLAAAAAAGVLSFEQLEWLLCVATPANQRRLLELAHELGDADALRDEVKGLEREAKAAAEQASAVPAGLPPVPEVRWWWRDDALRLEADIPGADGVAVELALLSLAERAPKDPVSGVYRDMDVRAGEAIVQMASTALAAEREDGVGFTPDQATIVVHVAAEALVTRQGPAWEAATRIFSEAQLDRLACDARLQPATTDSSGVTVGVGRTTRKIAPWLRRLVEGRDRHCRYPGCTRSRWLNIHHRIPWSRGGPTNLDNLIALCGFHHRLVHSAGLQLVGPAEGTVRVTNRHGTRLMPALARAPDDRERSRLRHFEQRAATRRAVLAGAPP